METKKKLKSSTAYLLECYIWLVNTLARGPVSRAAIDEKWAHSSVNEYKQDYLPESNFHRWKSTVEMLFDVHIKCNAYNEYYIEEASDLRGADLRLRLLNLMSMDSLLKDSKKLRDRILFEHVPSGEKFLAPIIEALRDHYSIQITHQGFGKPRPYTFVVEPYCLKMFKQSWYMLARSPYDDEFRVYGLDRILALESTGQKYDLPDGPCAAERIFRQVYGVTMLEGGTEEIIISISEDQASYLRTLPIHPSQREIEPINGYPAFSFNVYPSAEFCQELFKYGSDLEVHEPESLRNYFAEDADRVNKMYNH